jgi:arylsulfatase A-like enzyme
MRRSYPSAAAAVLLLYGLTIGAVASDQGELQTRPNVVVIMTDDVGYGDIGSYGAPDIRTPHIDSLGHDGVRMTDFYANAAQCSPTRAALITGRYPQRFAIEDALGAAASGPFGKHGLPVSGRSLPQLLRSNGFATALIGKWHLGYLPQFSPRAHGFDYFFGFKAGYIDYYQHTAGDGRPDLWENDTPIARTGYMTDLITTRSVEFIEQHVNRAFFLEVAYSAAHWPYQPPDHPSTAVDNARHVLPHEANAPTRSDYVAMLERADRGVGEILAALDRTGAARNTLVIFTNDNGGEWLSRNAPLSHRKWSMWEGGIRVPTLIRWPGRIPAGRVSAQVGATMDLTATIFAATRTAAPADARLDGVNLLPVLEGATAEFERTIFWRSIARGWNQRAVRRGNWKVLADNGQVMLFDVRRDPAERDDLASRHPDVVRSLWPLIGQWEKDVNAEAIAKTP